MIAYGVGIGTTLAIVGALVAAGFGGGSNSLDNRPEATAVVSNGGAPTDDGEPIEEVPTELPVLETPTDVPIEEPTDEPVAPEPAPTDVLVEEATPTEAPIEEPTVVPTVVGGA